MWMMLVLDGGPPETTSFLALLKLLKIRTLILTPSFFISLLFLFPFWLLAGFWALSTLVCIALKFFSNLPAEYLLYAIAFESFLFIFSILSTVSLMGDAIRLGLFFASLGE
jgi:hypothetical protein